jgi:LytS/YehU family sensor histidine kinase
MQDIEIKLQEAEKQKVMSELKVLKAQLNPHFLFNALNNIYSLSLENNPKTPGIILKLSELMNYILYESRAEKVPVKKEIEFIRNYIELEKSRYEDSIQVSFSSDDNNFENLQIAPLLFIPFIENAFKHCGNGNNNIPKIDIIFDSSYLPLLSIRVMNTKDCSVLDKTKNKGVGLENVKQRLELIYHNRYNLLITENESGFLVDLAIKL